MKKLKRSGKVWTRIYLFAFAVILLMIFGLIFSVRSINRISDEAVTYVGQTSPKEQESYDMAEVQQQIESAALGIKRQYLIFGILLVIAAVVLLIWMICHMIVSVQTIEDVLKKMSEEDFLADTKENIRGDMETLENFDSISESLEKLHETVCAQISEARKETAVLAQKLDGVYLEMDGMDGNIQGMIEVLEKASSDMNSIDTYTAQMDHFSREIQEAAKNMALRVQKGAEQADAIFAHASNTKEQTSEKCDWVKQNQDEMRESLGRALDDVKAVEQISSLAETLMSVTEQTNLLSLNASIEAARSGEVGREFVVASDEIRKLADQSRETIENIQWITDKAGTAVEHLKYDFERLFTFVNEKVISGFDNFDKIADDYNSDAEEVNSLIYDFSITSEELFHTIKNILESVEKLSQEVGESTENISEITEAVGYVASHLSSLTKSK